MRIAVAMSGGVDSSVAALILLREGHDVVGLTMTLGALVGSGGDDLIGAADSAGGTVGNRPQHGWAKSAARAAMFLGVEHHVVDLAATFEQSVVSYFLSEYFSGRTPNPCVICNRRVKFGRLLEEARGLGAEFLATGHHARVIRDDGGGAPRLAMGRDPSKDQSYFLHKLTREQLEATLMPIGEFMKDDVRAIARDAGLPAAAARESADICFLSGRSLSEFLLEHAPNGMQGGPIEDVEGRILGEHKGIASYTIGQRGGLGLSRPRPTYVIEIVPRRNALIVGDDEDLYCDTLQASELRWPSGVPPTQLRWPSGVSPTRLRAQAKIRYAAQPTACDVTLGGEGITVHFDEPQRAITPGQFIVLYDGDIVLGGGVIDGAVR
jgi:tRNA-specific 2-thiouridylase